MQIPSPVSSPTSLVMPPQSPLLLYVIFFLNLSISKLQSTDLFFSVYMSLGNYLNLKKKCINSKKI